MKCPYCSNEMEKGYIAQSDFRFPLEWSPAERRTGILFSKKRNIKLTTALKGGNMTAYHCAECRKFIIDENELEK